MFHGSCIQQDKSAQPRGQLFSFDYENQELADNFSFLPCADDPRPLVDLEPAPGAVPDEEVVQVVVGVGILGLQKKLNQRPS